jgi:hypothetical protein
MSPLQHVKFVLGSHLGLAKDALHVYAGLAAFFAAMLLLGWRPHQWKPFALVVAIAVFGELWDLRDSLVFRTPIFLWANWHDVWNTCFWPGAILLLARLTPIFRQQR